MKRIRGSITPHGGRWRVRVMVGGERRSFGLCDTYDAAEKRLAAAIQQIESIPAGKTLAAWGVEWLDRRDRDGIRSTSRDRSRWAQHVADSTIGHRVLRRIERQHVLAWVRSVMETEALTVKTFGRGETKRVETSGAGRTVSRQTAVHALNLVRSALAAALDDGLVSTNVAADVRVPPGRSDESEGDAWTWLAAEEIAALRTCAEIPERHRIVYDVAIYTGLRKGELWGLRWTDVVLDGPRPELIVRHSYRGPTKSKKVRRVPLLPRALDALRRWRAMKPGVGNALVWPSPKGGCHGASYSAEWDRWKVRAGIERPIRFHDLRHTCASHLVMGTWCPPMRLEQVAKWLGHSSIIVTQRYAHLSADSIHAHVGAGRKEAEEQ